MTKKRPTSSAERPKNLSDWARKAGVSEEQMALNLAAAQPVLEVLKNICQDKQSNKGETDYSCPSWAYKQAHKNGFNEALRFIENYLP